MSASAQRLVAATEAPRMEWQRPEMIARTPRFPGMTFVQAPIVGLPVLPRSTEARDVHTPPPLSDRVVAADRDGYARGFAEGQRLGEHAASGQAQEVVGRLVSTIESVIALRGQVLRKAEHDLVKLALAMAERVLRRQVEAERDLLVVMARAAIDRLGENVTATIHLNPEDYAAATDGRAPTDDTSNVQVVADPQVPPGGCLVRSPFGVIDAGLDTQVRELSEAMLGDLSSQEAQRGDLPRD
jgi:flagellar assembly protein FliH